MPIGDNLDVHVATDVAAYDIRDVIYDGRPARVLYSSATHTAQSGLAYDDNPNLLFDYMERFMELTRGLRPKRILLIGGGAFILPAALQREFADSQLTVVEIDAKLESLATQYFGWHPGEHTTVYGADGLAFLAADTNRYDLILLDIFAEATIPQGFQTDDTAQLLARHLTEQGTLAMNIIAALHGPRSGLLRRQIMAWQTAFADVQLFPAGYDQSQWFPQNLILIGRIQSLELTQYLRYAPFELPT